MRATSLPTALPVAAAALALVAAALVPLVVPSTALAERWLRPVPGEVARPFAYSRAAPFAAGAHRGADLAAPAGAAVRSACAGQVIHAGAVAGRGQVVSVRCGDRRVSYLPLATVAVRAGTAVGAGARIGGLAPGHGGLHVGIRREGDAFGYENPMALMPANDAPFAPAAPARRPPATVPRPAAPPAATPAPSGRARRPRIALPPAASETSRRPAWPVTSPRPLAGRAPSALAPWPVWLGLIALLSGAAGSGTIAVGVRRRRQRSRGARLAAAPP